ncbi:hypothetical protein BUALT_Bualt12G0086400 [Buddleja alternifolia]|uniref:Uncharacterized protein n=1 Tax=Buddleja alternifolia TaxID=168488 RepID=A0AAV6WQ61_9LAMI|nr:hypothetical protein BUALT_Bualt12G0086400 [Buddleja alternifolia]
MDIVGAYGTLRPITYSKINRHVLFQHDYDFFWFDTDNNCAKKIRIDGLNDSFCCQIWSPSLFRLENYVCSGEGVSAKPLKGVKKKRAIKRLKLEVTITESWDRSDSNYSSYSSEGEYY